MPYSMVIKIRIDIYIENLFSDVLNCLSAIILVSKKREEIQEATALKKKISKFDFVLMLVFHYNILKKTNIIAQTLQKTQIGLDKACGLLKKASDEMEAMRNNFNNIVMEAEKVAQSWKITPQLEEKRVRTVKRFHDELAADTTFQDPYERFRVKVFIKSMDIICTQLKDRFLGVQAINDSFDFIRPYSLLNYSEEKLIEAAGTLVKKYPTDLSDALKNEIVSFKHIFSKIADPKKIKYIFDVAQLLFVNYYCLTSSLPNLCSAYILFLTLPIGSVAAETSFSKLKLIKTYLSSTMIQERLSSLGILSIEHERAQKLDLEAIVDTFLERRERRGLKI